MKPPILYVVPTKKHILGFVVDGQQVYVDKITPKQISKGTAIKHIISSGADMTKSRLLADIYFTSEYVRYSILSSQKTNTSLAPTLNLDSLGIKTIVKERSVDEG